MLKSLYRNRHEIKLIIQKQINYKVLLQEHKLKTVFGGWTSFLKNLKFVRIIPFTWVETLENDLIF